MVRDSRIKEFRFSQVINATSTGSFVSDHVINGEILEVNYAYGSQGATGSLWLTFAGTSETFWKDLSASGAGTQVARPYAAVTLNDGTIPNGSEVVSYVCNDKLVLNTGSILSGTTAVTTNIYYR